MICEVCIVFIKLSLIHRFFRGLFYMQEVLIYSMSKNRNKIERWLNRHNHTMEFIRTLVAITIFLLQIVILMRLFSQWKINLGAVAQLGERSVRNAEAVGSIPIGSTTKQLIIRWIFLILTNISIRILTIPGNPLPRRASSSLCWGMFYMFWKN